jgi:hypothetical protein
MSQKRRNFQGDFRKGNQKIFYFVSLKGKELTRPQPGDAENPGAAKGSKRWRME